MNDTTNDNNNNTSAFDAFIASMPGLDDDEENTVIDHQAIHPFVVAAFATLSGAPDPHISELASQIMACCATELVNGFVPNLKVIDAGDLEVQRPLVFIIDGDQLYEFVSDVQVLTAYIVRQVEAKWEEKYGKPKAG